MKFAVKIVLLMFLTFIVTPTIVSLIEEDIDTSMVYSMSEEEHHNHSCKELKELKADLSSVDYFVFSKYTAKSSGLIISRHSLKYDNTASSIFSPPPEHV
jgi:hypothetical protein